MLDFSVLEHLGKVAIQCKTQSDADKLLEEMWAQHPEMMNYWNHNDAKWNTYKERTCYAPHIYDELAPCMQYCNVSYWKSELYTIVQFEDLLQAQQDFGELEIGEISLSSLFSVNEIGVLYG